MRGKIFTSFEFIILGLISTVNSGEFSDVDAGKAYDQDLLHNKIFRNMEERCLEIGGQSVLDDYLSEQEQLIFCVMEQFGDIKEKIDTKKNVKELEGVFEIYCRSHVSAARVCLENFLSVSRQCLRPRERSGLNVTLNMINEALDFICHNLGDRISLFLSVEGVQCVTDNSEEIMSCMNSSIPEVFNPRTKNHNIHFYVFQEQNCRKGDAIMDCIESSLLRCPDPTSSNLIVDGLLKSMKNVTPCSSCNRLSPGYKLRLVFGLVIVSMGFRL